MTAEAGTVTSLTARAEADRHRPRYHFVSPAGWLNDPNGLCQWDGTYHLFYQYNPEAPVHHRIHWGHATSRDLVTWTDEPVALVPDDDGPDRDGCWSGVLVDDGGVPTIIYSGRHGDRELPCVAVGSADLRTWVKDPANPVVGAIPPGLELTAYRDHCVWREGDRWRQLVGSGIAGHGGTALVYESRDLRDWTYVGPLHVGDATTGQVGDPDWTGTMWECVDLFRPPVEPEVEPSSPDVLVFSAWDQGVTHHPLYWTGRYTGDTFEPLTLHRLDYGGRYFYAPQSMRDEAGRRVMFGWLQEGRSEDAYVAAGWSGVMSLPRVVTMGADGQLVQAPAPEVASLRGAAVRTAAQPLSPVPLGVGSGDQLDVELDLSLAPGTQIEVALRATDDGSERTILLLERHAAGSGRLVLDRSASSLDATVDATPRSGSVPIGDDGRVSLRVLVDHSALEIFANGRALTARLYPTRPDALGVTVSAAGDALLEAAAAWPMHDIWQGPRPVRPEL